MREEGFQPVRRALIALLGLVAVAGVMVLAAGAQARDSHREVEPRAVIAPRPEPRTIIAPQAQARTVDSYIGRDQDRVREAREAGKIKPFGEIKKAITKQFGGHIIDVDLDQDDPSSENWIYRVRMLSDNGKVLLIQADAATGKIVDVKGQK